LLPAWKECLENVKLAIKIMPCDISTRWNSTYDMLCFAIQYRMAIEGMTSDQKNDLRQFELAEEEWEIAEELRDTLKVRSLLRQRCGGGGSAALSAHHYRWT
jgi:hypothetical protein